MASSTVLNAPASDLSRPALPPPTATVYSPPTVALAPSAPPPAVPPDALYTRLQATLGTAYTLTRELGGGGMSRVFLAREMALERDVVVKVLHPDLAAGVSAERFTREIKLAAGLQQANIVPLLAAGETDGLPYYTMPFVDGLSLRARLEREGALQVSEAISILRDVARALDYAHEHGVVHRDIKPENILLSGRSAVVTDFGIAKALAASKTRSTDDPTSAGHTRGTLTQVGTSIGTPAYMAPEQALGDPSTDRRADLYALGCVAYELLSGSPPFANRTPQQLFAAHLSEVPAPLSIKRPEVPQALAELVAGCLEKDPAGRPQNARAVLAALDEISVNSHTGHRVEVIAADGRPHQARRILTVAALLAVVSVAVFGVRALRARGAADTAYPSERSIAVLPFENLGDSADAYFADGVTDAVRGKLSALPGLRVIARVSSNQYRSTTKSPRQIGEELGVAYLLTATVRWEKHGAGGVSRVQVRPELLAVRDASSKWQEPFDAELTGVFQVQADIAGRVAEKLDLALGDSTKRVLAAAPTANLAAYDAYLRAQAAVQGGAVNDPPSIRRALPLLEQAVRLDSAFALAWSELANIRALLYSVSTPTPTLAQRTREAAERAAALAPGSAEGATALGAYHVFVTGDIPRALELFGAGLRVAPNDALMLARTSRAEMTMGQWEGALAHIQRARALDPRSANVARAETMVLLRLRRYPEARGAADSALALAPTSLAPIQNRAMVALGTGDLEGARAVLRATPATVERSALFAYMANYLDLYWVLDDTGQRTVLTLPVSAFDNDRGAWGIVRAQTYFLRGDLAHARVYADSARLAYEEQLRAFPGDAQRHATRGLALAYLGRRAEAMAEGERATQLVPVNRDAYNGAYFQHVLARIYTLAGEREKASEVIERLLRIPYVVSPGWLRIDPNFASLRGDPRFVRLTGGE